MGRHRPTPAEAERGRRFVELLRVARRIRSESPELSHYDATEMAAAEIGYPDRKLRRLRADVDGPLDPDQRHQR